MFEPTRIQFFFCPTRRVLIFLNSYVFIKQSVGFTKKYAKYNILTLEIKFIIIMVTLLKIKLYYVNIICLCGNCC